MAINKKLIHFKTLEKFNTELANGNILDTSIVFIQDAQKIWTHGTLYDCDAATLREEIIKNEEVVAAALNDLQENKASKTYVDEAVANAGGGDDIYVFEPIDGTVNEDGTLSGTITEEQAEAIKKATFIQSTSGETFTRCAVEDSKYQYTYYVNDESEYYSNIVEFDVEALTYTVNIVIGNNVTGVTINGATKNPTNGVVDLGTVITAHQTLKTINGESIVGEGDITIEGGGDGFYIVYVGESITEEQKQHNAEVFSKLPEGHISNVAVQKKNMFVKRIVNIDKSEQELTIVVLVTNMVPTNSIIEVGNTFLHQFSITPDGSVNSVLSAPFYIDLANPSVDLLYFQLYALSGIDEKIPVFNPYPTVEVGYVDHIFDLYELTQEAADFLIQYKDGSTAILTVYNNGTYTLTPNKSDSGSSFKELHIANYGNNTTLTDEQKAENLAILREVEESKVITRLDVAPFITERFGLPAGSFVDVYSMQETGGQGQFLYEFTFPDSASLTVKYILTVIVQADGNATLESYEIPLTNTGGGSSNVATITLDTTLSSLGGTFTAVQQAILFDTNIGVVVIQNSNKTQTWVLHRDSTNSSNMPIDPRAVFTGTRRTSVTARSLMVLQVNRDGSYTYEEKAFAFQEDIPTNSGNKEVVIISNSATIDTLEPNKIYIVDCYGLDSVEIASIQLPDVDYYAEYTVVFLYGSHTGGGDIPTAPSIILPTYIKWANGEVPDLAGSTSCELSVVWSAGMTNDSHNAVLVPFK